MKEDLSDLGILFTDTDTALKEHEEIFREHFGTIIPPADNKFAALNSAVWSGGSFIYVPKGVKCDTPLQAYFRINSENMGQFERTLIIADEDSSVHYVEGCTAPVYSTNSLHSAVVEIIVKKNAYCRYTTIQNWANNIYNLVTKRAVAEENATMEWIDGNIGSRLTMKYPAVVMKGRGAKGTILSIAIAGKGQHQDAGAKVLHLAPDCSSTIVSKSISKHGGKVTYRGIAHFGRRSDGSKANIKCDTLIMDNESTSDTIPYNEILNNNITLEHEATVSKVSEDQLFYLMSRGVSEQEATEMIVMGFIEPFTKELPMEYAVEMNRLIKFEMEGSIG
jgi:Fe-S cluster assembly protein SufB